MVVVAITGQVSGGIIEGADAAGLEEVLSEQLGWMMQLLGTSWHNSCPRECRCEVLVVP